MKVFLTAKWKNLINVTYDIDPKILLPYLPKGLDLDTINGRAFVSFVAFDFEDVRIKGIKIPFHNSFPEINLRFYVNKNGKRGVVFIKEFVPKYFVALVANKLYNEPYTSTKMKSTVEHTDDAIEVSHSFAVKEEWFKVALQAQNKCFVPANDSMEHFFKEHEVGFGKDKKGNLLEYKVAHPLWEIYPIIKIDLNLSFEKIYGDQWKFLNNQKPFNVLLAKGSDVVVFDKE